MADLLLNEAGVACLNGAAFGEYGEGYLRFSYASSFENLMEALERIRRASQRWQATAALPAWPSNRTPRPDLH
jgi:aspartate/methionine/tyrosine aminotransferase